MTLWNELPQGRRATKIATKDNDKGKIATAMRHGDGGKAGKAIQSIISPGVAADTPEDEKQMWLVCAVVSFSIGMVGGGYLWHQRNLYTRQGESTSVKSVPRAEHSLDKSPFTYSVFCHPCF